MVAAGIVFTVMSGGIATPATEMLIASGIGMVIAGIGTLLSKGPLTGTTTTHRGTVDPWTIGYGRFATGGTMVYVGEWGVKNQWCDMVIVLAGHPCASVDALLFDGQRVRLDANGCSFPPTQQTVSIVSISRTNDIVTMQLAHAVTDLQDGDSLIVESVSDRTFNGTFPMTLVNPTKMTYLCGGAQVASITNSGVVKTMWPNYGAKVHMEVLLGKHTATFPGMLNGTPYDGDLSRTPVLNANNPWGPTCLLLRKTSVFLRLHYSDSIFANGLPTIKFHVSGKAGIFDPRATDSSGASDVVITRPLTFMNGWGNNAHVGPYEMGSSEATNWGLNNDTTHPYSSPDAACDPLAAAGVQSNLATAATVNIYHEHKYAGCIWSFTGYWPGNTDPSVAGHPWWLNVYSAIPVTASNAPVTLRSAGIWYSFDSGASWTQLYNSPTHELGWDSVQLPSNQTITHVQVMAFCDAHDDMSHAVYDINLALTSFQAASGGARSSTAGYTENAALCIADFLADPVYGFGAAYGTDIPLPQLIAAANICDEQVALAQGGAEPRYALNGSFQLNMKRGEILQNMLTSCAGRLTYSAGEYIIWPAAWYGTSGALPAPVPIPDGQRIAWAYPTSVNTGLNEGCETRLYPAPPDPTSRVVVIAAWTGAANPNAPGTGAIQTIRYVPGDPCACYNPGTSANPQGTIGIEWSGFQMPVLPADAVIQALWPTITAESPGPCDGAFTAAVGPGANAWQFPNMTTPDGISGFITPNLSTDNPVFPPTVCLPLLDLGSTSGLGNTAEAVTASTIAAAIYGEGGGEAQLVKLSGVAIAVYFTSASQPTDPPGEGRAGANLSIDALNMSAGPFQWKAKLPIRDLYNGVKGTYVSPVNNWQSSDIPPYAQDFDHGYQSGTPVFPFGDANLAADGGVRRWLDIQLPFTISVACAQRLCKIELLRRRQQGTGTFRFNMALYQATALDVLAVNLALLGWSGKLLEVSAHRFTLNKQQLDGEEVTLLGTEIDVQETDPSVYEWNTSDELSAQGFALTSGTGATDGTGAGGTSTVPSYTTYSNTPAVALTQPNSTTIQLAAVAVAFAATTLQYNARTLTIPAPAGTTHQWYYVTIADPNFYGDSGSGIPLEVFAEPTPAKLGLKGFIYMGAIYVNSIGIAAVALPGGWPAPESFLIGH